MVQFVLQALDFRVTLVDGASLAVKLGCQVAVLVATLVMNHDLFVDLSAQCLNQSDVAVDALSVLVFHQTLLFIQATEGLLECQHLVLQSAVVPLLGAKVGGLLS